jgi:transcription elongation factor GreA
MANSNDDVLEITKEAFEELQTELEQRKNKLREEIAAEIKEARELGDLSENHAYSTAMEKKELNENRIAELESMLKNAKVASGSKSSKVARVGRSIEILNKKTNKIE